MRGRPRGRAQVRECATALLHVAKREGVPIFLVGHVTKARPGVPACTIPLIEPYRNHCSPNPAQHWQTACLPPLLLPRGQRRRAGGAAAARARRPESAGGVR